MCDRLASQDGLTRHFGVAPAPGTAVVWWHYTPEGEEGALRPSSAPSAWHGGCPFVGRKVILRSFFEIDGLGSRRVISPIHDGSDDSVSCAY